MKTCPKCGLSMSDESRFCSACGADTLPGVAATAQTALSQAPSSSIQTPTSGKALASMILGICSFFFSILTGIPAIIFGHLAKTEIRQSRGRLQGDGMALAGLILGYLSVVFIPMILIIAAIAIPNLLRARMAANEASAVGSLRTIVTASVTYSSTYGHGFPPTLAALGSPASGESSGAAHADLIDSTLAAGFKSGYAFTYEAYGDGGKVPAPPPGFILDRGTVDAFRINADPIEPNTTGVRDFYVDQTGVIRYQNDAPANENSPPIQ